MTSQVSELTEAERLFEQACAARGIQFRRIPVATASATRRPDYKATAGRCGIIVEVKQIAPNETDKQQARDLAAGRIVAWTLRPGDRLRPCIRDAAGQLQSRSKRGIPTVVAVYDSLHSLTYTDPYNVKVAMYGLDAVVLALPNDPAASPHPIGWKGAGKATLTDEHNTSISAVAIIREFPPDVEPAPDFLLYHNHFARVPLNPHLVRPYVWAQYALGRADNGATNWIEILGEEHRSKGNV